MTDEHCDFETIFNRKDDYSYVGLGCKARGEDDGQEGNVATLEVHQCGGDD
jgi:hypothetical protein